MTRTELAMIELDLLRRVDIGLVLDQQLHCRLTSFLHRLDEASSPVLP